MNEVTAQKDIAQGRPSVVGEWVKSGAPWIWLNAGAVGISVIMVIGLLIYIAIKGLVNFWPVDVVDATYAEPNKPAVHIIGEIRETEKVSIARLRSAGYELPGNEKFYDRYLVKTGNRDLFGGDFRNELALWLS